MNFAQVTPDMIIVFGLLCLAIFLFISDLLRVDLVGILMMVLLPLLGVVTAEEAVAGLSSNAVVSIIAVMIIGAGLNKTGIMNLVATRIIKFTGTKESRVLGVVSMVVAIISSFMQNIGSVALFLPVAMRICRKINISASKILMPMGFCAITGGCLTLIGSSPLIMLNDLMGAWWQNNSANVQGEFVPLSLFSITPIGILLLVGMLIYLMLIGRKLLPENLCEIDEDCMDKRLSEIYGNEVGRGFELAVPRSFTSQTLEELEIRPKYYVTVVGVFAGEGESKNNAPTKDTKILGGSVLWVMSSQKNVTRMAEELGWIVKPEIDVFRKENYPEVSGVVEAVVIPHSNLSHHTMEELRFRALFQVNPLAIVRGEEIIIESINITELRQGDTLIMHGKWEQFQLLSQKMDLAFIADIKGAECKPEKTRIALFFVIMSLILALSFQVKLSIALLTGALGMILTGVIRADRAYEAVDWRTVFLLAGLIPLGTAFEKTGAATFIAELTLQAMGTSSVLVLMLVISMLTAFFSLVASNVGSVVLMVPLAMTMATELGADPILAALVVAISSSNTFVLPTHQVNALIMRPGDYRTGDYMRVGIGATIMFTAILMLSLKIFYGL